METYDFVNLFILFFKDYESPSFKTIVIRIKIPFSTL